MQTAASPALRSPANRAMRPADARRPSHDGYFWPLPRHEMVTKSHIAERMRGDAKALLAERGREGEIAEADFRRLGWLDSQIAEHGAIAIASALHDA